MRKISLLLVLSLILSILVVPAGAANGEEEVYSVRYYSSNASSVTFRISVTSLPTENTDVYYRIWSGDGHQVEDKTGFVTFKNDDYSSAALYRDVTVSFVEPPEGVTAYYSGEGGGSATMSFMLLGVDGDGSIDWKNAVVSHKTPARQKINTDVVYDKKASDNQFYVTNSVEMYLDVRDDEVQAMSLKEEPAAVPEASSDVKAQLMFNPMMTVLKFGLKTVVKRANQGFEERTGYDMVSYVLNLKDSDPNYGEVVSFLRNRDSLQGELTYFAGDADSGTKYDNKYYEYIKAKYLVYLEGEAWNNDVDSAKAEDARLTIYDMGGGAFQGTDSSSSTGYTWVDYSPGPYDTYLFNGWEDYTNFTETNDKFSIPTAGGSAESGFNNFEINSGKVRKLEKAITVPHGSGYNNNLTGYTPKYKSVNNVMVLDNPRLGYYMELPKITTDCSFLLEQNYIYYMVEDTTAPAPVSMTMSNDQYGKDNEIRVRVDFDEIVAKYYTSDAKIVVRDLNDQHVATLDPVNNGGQGSSLEFSGKYSGTGAVSGVKLVFTADQIGDPTGNRSGKVSLTQEFSDVRLVQKYDVVNPATPRVTAKDHTGDKYTPGTTTNNNVMLTATSSSPSGIAYWEVKNLNDPNGDWESIDSGVSVNLSYGSGSIDKDGTLGFTVNEPGVYKLRFRATANSGKVSAESETFYVVYRTGDDIGQFYIKSFTVGEADENGKAPITLTISRLGGSYGRYRVNYDINPGNLLNTYALSGGSVIFEDGDSADKQVQQTYSLNRDVTWFDGYPNAGKFNGSQLPNPGVFPEAIITGVEEDTGSFVNSETEWKEAPDTLIDKSKAFVRLENAFTWPGKPMQMHYKTMFPQKNENSRSFGNKTDGNPATEEALYDRMGAKAYFRVKGTQSMEPSFILNVKNAHFYVGYNGTFFHGWEDTNNVNGDSFDLPGTHHFNNYTQTSDSTKIYRGYKDNKDYYVGSFGQMDVNWTAPEDYHDGFKNVHYRYHVDYTFNYYAEDHKNPEFNKMTAKAYQYSDGDRLYVRLSFSEPVYVDESLKLTIRQKETMTTYGELGYTRGNGSDVLLFSGKITKDGEQNIKLNSKEAVIIWPAKSDAEGSADPVVYDAAGNKLEGLIGRAWTVTLDGVEIDPDMPGTTVRDGGIFYIKNFGTTKVDGQDFYFADVVRDGGEGDQTVYVRTFNYNAGGYFVPDDIVLSFKDGVTRSKRVYIARDTPSDNSMNAYAHKGVVHRSFGIEIYNIFGGGRVAEAAYELPYESTIDVDTWNRYVNRDASWNNGTQKYDLRPAAVKFNFKTKHEVDDNYLVKKNSAWNYMKLLKHEAVQSNEPSLTMDPSVNDYNVKYFNMAPSTYALMLAETLTVRVAWVLNGKNVNFYIKDQEKNTLFHGWEDYDNLTDTSDKIGETHRLPEKHYFNNSNAYSNAVGVSERNIYADGTKVTNLFRTGSAYLRYETTNSTGEDVKLNYNKLYYIFEDETAPKLKGAEIDKDYTLPGRKVRINYVFDELVKVGDSNLLELHIYSQSDPENTLIELDYACGSGTNILTFVGDMPAETLPDNLEYKLIYNNDSYGNNKQITDLSGNVFNLENGVVNEDMDLRNAPLPPEFTYSYTPAQAGDGYYSQVTVEMKSSEADITIYYSLDGHSEDSFFKGETGTGKASVTVTDSGVHTLYAMCVRESDRAKSAMIATETFRIDNSTPTINIWNNGSGWTNQDIYYYYTTYGGLASHKVTVQRTDVDIPAEPEDITAYSGYIVQDNGTYQFKVTNTLGRSAFVDLVVDRIDKAAPTLTTVSFAKNEAGNKLYIAASANETQSGLDHFQYRFDYYNGGVLVRQELQTLPAGVPYIDEEGRYRLLFSVDIPEGTDHVLHLFPVDAAGNVDYLDSQGDVVYVPVELKTAVLAADEEEPNSPYQFAIDVGKLPLEEGTPANPPELKVEVGGGEPAPENGWYKASPRYSVTAESEAGLKSVSWVLTGDGENSVQGGQNCNGATSSTFTFNPGVTASGKYSLTVTATDNRGQSAIESLSLNVDGTPPAAPSLLVNGAAFVPGTEYEATDFFKLSAGGDVGVSGSIAQLKVGETWVDAVYGGIQVNPGAYTVTARSLDGAGNASEEVTFTVNVKEPGLGEVYVKAATEYKGQWTKDNVTFNLTKVAADGAAEYSFYYSTDNGTTWAATNGTPFTVTQSGTYMFAAMKQSETRPLVVNGTTYEVKIDKEVPTTPTIPNMTIANGWVTDPSVTITNTQPNNASPETVLYSTDGTVWTPAPDGTIPLKLGEYTLQVKVADQAGNESAVASKQIKVDNVKPSLRLTAVAYPENSNLADLSAAYDGSPTRHNVRISVNPVAGVSGISKLEYTTDPEPPAAVNKAANQDVTWTELSADGEGKYALEIKAETGGEKTYRFKVTSQSGITSDILGQPVNVNRTAPDSAFITINRAPGDGAKGDYYTKAPTISVATPPEEGVSVWYNLIKDGTAGGLTRFTGTAPALSGDGSYELRVYTKDSAGNFYKDTSNNTLYASRTIILDGTPPEFTMEESREIKTKPEADLPLDFSNKVTDAVSGIKEYTFVKYAQTSSGWGSGEVTTNTDGKYTVSQNFVGKVELTVTDNAGNTGEKYTVFFTPKDKTAPAVSFNVNGGEYSGGWYRGEVSLTVTAWDRKGEGDENISGVKEIELSVLRGSMDANEGELRSGVIEADGGQAFSKTGTFKRSGVFSVTAYATDMNGNRSAEPAETMVRVDKILPVITVGSLSGGVLPVTARDTLSGVSQTSYQLVSGQGNYDPDGWIAAPGASFNAPIPDGFSGRIYVKALDKAGNEAIESFDVSGGSVAPSGGGGEPQEPWENPFLDVSEGDWFYDHVGFMARNGLMNGVSPDSFDPDGETSRAMFITILWRAAGSPSASGGSFTDLTEDWYRQAAEWGAENGIVKGVGQGLFDPDSPITREQMAVMMYNFAAFMGLPTENSGRVDGFKDSGDISEYARDAMAWAIENGLIEGHDDGRLEPQGKALRSHCAALLHRFFEGFGLI